MDKRKLKGQQTRQRILEATLQLIADQGIEKVTHRAVAQVADINFSLLNYHFKDIDSLLVEAFGLYVSRSEVETAGVWSELGSFLAKYPAPKEWTETQKTEIIEHLTNYSTQYVIGQFTDSRRGIIVELTFIYDPHINVELNRHAQSHKQRLLRELSVFCQQLGSKQAANDACLLLGCIQRLIYEGVIDSSETHKTNVKQQLGRILSLIVKDS